MYLIHMHEYKCYTRNKIAKNTNKYAHESTNVHIYIVTLIYRACLVNGSHHDTVVWQPGPYTDKNSEVHIF